MDSENGNHIQRNFGFCKILWTIENFWLATSKKVWEINSPKFSVRGPQVTSWNMNLKLGPKEKDNNDCFLFVYLKRSEADSGPDVVRANWKLSFLNCKRKENLFSEIEYLFKKNHCYGEIIDNVKCLLTDFEPFEVDDLIIQCQLIVTCDTNFNPVTKCSNIGVRYLSDDLRILSRNIYDFDMLIRIGHHCIPVFKAILHARNPTLASIIDRNPAIEVINLLTSDFYEPTSENSSEIQLISASFINTNAVERIVDYIYSGMLEEVTGKPTVCIAECAMLFDIKEVIAYYTPDELFLNTTIDVEENVFTWFITSFELRKENLILSPPFIKGQMKSIWRLKLFPKGVDNTGEYISLYAEILEERTAEDVCLEFAVIGADKKFHCFRRIQKSLGLGEILGFDDFFKRDLLENPPFLNDETLRIIFKIRTSVGLPSFSNKHVSIVSIISPPHPEFNFILLSEQIADMMYENEFSDFVIHCDDETFKVHYCIMIARSDNFCDIANCYKSDQNEIFIPEMKAKILRILLSYLYSGVLGDVDPKDIHEVYIAATIFGVDILINTCSRILTQNYFRFPDSPEIDC